MGAQKHHTRADTIIKGDTCLHSSILGIIRYVTPLHLRQHDGWKNDWTEKVRKTIIKMVRHAEHIKGPTINSMI